MDELGLALASELKGVIKVNRMNDELLEVLSGNLRWLIRYSETTGFSFQSGPGWIDCSTEPLR